MARPWSKSNPGISSRRQRSPKGTHERLLSTPTATPVSGWLLEVRAAGKTYSRHGETTAAVSAMSLALPAEQPRLLTLAGESGSGKSTLAWMILGLLRPTSGRILYQGTDIYQARGADFRRFRRDVQAVFQNPFEVFNPFYRIDHAFDLALRQLGCSRRSPESRERVRDSLDAVQLDADEVLGRYPHQLSGGQLQRVSIARVVLLRPRILIADEPVSMIDASLRQRVLRQLVDLKQRLGISIIYITHDLSTALPISDEVLIAWRGQIVERGTARSIIENPQHDYTRLLISSIPVPDPRERWTAAAGVDSLQAR
jgi:peptide/nickel transport system ATP-binding protein